MRLFHGTSSKLVDKIREQGLIRSNHQNWGMAISAMDSLNKAEGVAGYFGADGIIIEIEIPDDWVEFHPDYGYSPEFDTIYIKEDVPPSRIINIHNAPNPNRKNIRPVGIPLRQWKSSLMDDGLVDEGLTIPQRRSLIG